MRLDRRSSVAGVALIGVALLLVLDPLGLHGQLRDWFRVSGAAAGSTRAIAATASDRATRVEALAEALGADPVLSLALLAVGVGVGLIAGSTAAYLHQRRRLQRGERDA